MHVGSLAIFEGGGTGLAFRYLRRPDGGIDSVRLDRDQRTFIGGLAIHEASLHTAAKHHHAGSAGEVPMQSVMLHLRFSSRASTDGGDGTRPGAATPIATPTFDPNKPPRGYSVRESYAPGERIVPE